MSDIEKQFKNTLISFLDELIGQFPHEGDLVIFRIFLKDKTPITTIIDYFIEKILPLKQMVVSRNEDFFLNHCSLFEQVDDTKKNKVNNFKRLWQSNQLDADDKKVIWEWFDTFIFLVEKYQKSNLKPS